MFLLRKKIEAWFSFSTVESSAVVEEGVIFDQRFKHNKPPQLMPFALLLDRLI